MGVALIVGFLEAKLGSVEVVVGKEKPTEIVEICDSLTGGVQCKWRRMLRNVGEKLMCKSCFSALCFLRDYRKL